MGLLGRYLDSVEDRHRDRVIVGQGWTSNCFIDENTGNKCVVGHAEAWYRLGAANASAAGGILRNRRNKLGETVYVRFDALCNRFGLARMTRLCKMRAAKGNQELVEKIRSGIYEELREARI